MLTWQELVRRSDHGLAELDLIAVNLACAAGLPDAENVDVQGCQHRVDHWSRRVLHETEWALPHFRRKRYDYRNSEAYFRMLVLVTVLQRDCRVRYNLAKADDEVPLDTADIFVHGITHGAGGTCTSLPVVYAAVGRRLGYPLKLVRARTPKWGHLFVRWDDPAGERFNVEATSLGLNSDPDDYYRSGVYSVTPAEEQKACLLQSLTPRQELAGFLAERGFRWLDFGRYRRAVEGFAWARVLHPENAAYRMTLARQMDDWDESLRRQTPSRFPEFDITWPPRRYPDALPEILEQGIIALEAKENVLRNAEHEREWWGPLRRGEPCPPVPSRAIVKCRPGEMDIRFQYTLTT